LGKEIQLDFPTLADWETFASSARHIRVLFYRMVDGLKRDPAFRSIPKATVLLADSEHWTPQSGTGVWIPEGEGAALKQLVGWVPLWKRPRNCMLFDDDVLLIQNATRLNRADIVRDPVQISKVRDAFDSLAARLAR
jgi:hypothetical protein